MPDSFSVTAGQVPKVAKSYTAMRSLSVGGAAFLFAAVLLVGVALKIPMATPPSATSDYRGATGHFLERQGYRLLPLRESADRPRVAAVKGFGCQVQVIRATSQGWDQHSLQRTAGAGDEFFVIFNGALYDAHPGWRIKAFQYWDRARGRLGFAVPDRPVFAVIASPPCAARNLPWSQLYHAAQT